MVDRKMIVSFGVILIVALNPNLLTAEPCDMGSDVCEYTFKIEYKLTMMKGRQQLKAENGKLYPVAPYNPFHPVVPVNTSAVDPISPDGVLTMDGYEEPRLVVAVNGQIPGPAIEAYIGQTVVVNVENHLYSSDVTIHWHGLHQKGTPFMDGVPYASQCPIGAAQSFTYKFNLTQTGTYWYHSHSGAQRTMGLYGAVIIREKKTMTMPEHTMIVTDYNPYTDSESIHLKVSNGMFNFFHFPSSLVNGRGRFYPKRDEHNGAPLSRFTVKEGKQYRFRVIAAQAQYSYGVSIDGHHMQIVASDGFELKPYAADVFVIEPGERYDFIITANQKVGNYWIRGVHMDQFRNDTFEAILHYEGAPDKDPISAPKKFSESDPCVILNRGYYPKERYQKCVILSEMEAASDYEVPRIVSGKWREYFLNFALPGIPGQAPGSVNGRVYKEPSVNPLYQPNEVNTLCDNKDCGVDRLCTCTHSLTLNKDETVQLIFVNMGIGKGFDHPVHMHGHTFSVVKMGYPHYNKTTGELLAENPDIDCRGDPKINFCNDATWSNSKWGGDNIPGLKLKKAPLKDTLILPSGGYAVIRIKADNPGMWFMHCHTEMHSLAGMVMILNESFADVPKAPEHFPTCHSFTAGAISRIPTPIETTKAPENTPAPAPEPAPSVKEDRETEKMAFGILIAVICVLAVIIIVLIVIMARKRPSKNTYPMSGATNAGFESTKT